jgi:probable HAF family extracellular repeat protein
MAATDENGGNQVGHAFLYDATGMRDLGDLGGNYSEAHGINDLGQIVGYSTGGGTRGFLYENGAMLDLNALIDPASGWRIQTGNDINNAGQIVGIAQRDTEPWGHAVLLTPVPEPSATAVWIGCVGSLTVWRRKRGDG